MKDAHTRSHAVQARKAREYFCLALASALGLGLSPVAPATCGTLLGVMTHIAIVLVLPPSLQTMTLMSALTLTLVLNHVVTPWATEYWRSEDPRHFVLDEVAGYLLVPVLFRHGHLWQVVVWGFVLFRVFDIYKPPPAKQIDRLLKGSWGIVLDDLISALYAVAGLYILMWVGSFLGLEAWFIQDPIR